MPECPICSKEFSSRGPDSLTEHLRSRHFQYWTRAKRLRMLASLALVISLVLTALLITVFYSPDLLGFTLLGLAALFLAFSSVFSLSERGLAKKYRTPADKKESEIARKIRKHT